MFCFGCVHVSGASQGLPNLEMLNLLLRWSPLVTGCFGRECGGSGGLIAGTSGGPLDHGSGWSIAILMKTPQRIIVFCCLGIVS